MAVYKPSNLFPNLEEIDINEKNRYSCQVNTSGSSVQAYKMQILSEDGSEVLFDGQGTNLTTPVRNKDRLYIDVDKAFLPGLTNLKNNKNYQWNIRTYEAPINSNQKRATQICSGFLVGSTKYVIWAQPSLEALEQLQDTRYIEFSTKKESMMPILPGDKETKLPDGIHRERHKINFITKDLGQDKNFVKIEVDEPFKYNYLDGTQFKIFPCSDQQSLNSIYVAPNDELEQGRYIMIYNSAEEAQNAHLKGDLPDKVTQTPRETSRKIIGYGKETGEIRVEVPFKKIPKTGENAYLLFEYDRVEKKYKEIITESDQRIIGGMACKADGKNEELAISLVTNKWDAVTHRLFIQPNINIKSDETNPNELVFDNGTRIKIDKKKSPTGEDITFNKLDNTQWIIEPTQVVSAEKVSIIPKTKYIVFSDFQDSFPNSLFFARNKPVITLQYRKMILENEKNPVTNYIQINTAKKPWRDIEFKANWESSDDVKIQYYQYSLYDNNGQLITKTEENYDNELYWYFKGFSTTRIDKNELPLKYKIQIKIVDEFNKEFMVDQDFFIQYKTDKAIIPLTVTTNCQEQGLDVLVTAPIYIESTSVPPDVSVPQVPTVDRNDIGEDYVLHIPKAEILNYTREVTDKDIKPPLIIPKDFSAFAQFQLKNDFIDGIKNGAMEPVLEISHKITDDKNSEIQKFILKFGGITGLNYEADGSIKKNNNQFLFRLYSKTGMGAETLLRCFEGNQDFYNITENITQRFIQSNKYEYALQSKTKYEKVEVLPKVNINESKIYLLMNDQMMNESILYEHGLWKYEKGIWHRVVDTEHIFIEDLAQVSDLGIINSDYGSLGVPSNAIGKKPSGLKFNDLDGNLWIDDSASIYDTNKIILNNLWFSLFLKVIDGKVTCEIRSDTNKDAKPVSYLGGAKNYGWL